MPTASACLESPAPTGTKHPRPPRAGNPGPAQDGFLNDPGAHRSVVVGTERAMAIAVNWISGRRLCFPIGESELETNPNLG